MKLLSSIVLLMFVAPVVCAQLEVTTRESSGLEVISFSWSKERIGWERDPFGGPLENFDEMRSRTRNEKRLDDAKRGGGSAGADRVRREASADAANLARQREKSPPRYVFVYKVKVKNNEATPVTAVDWDYVFFERGTENEVGRHEFTSEEQIGPGKTREFTVTVANPPTHTVSVTSLNLSEREQLTGKVVLIRVHYSDGRVWQTPL
jgi:hypothetical protein